jgi:4-amino-4-deoxy-L-arabinose transferase-like glycosyltransferase
VFEKIHIPLFATLLSVFVFGLSFYHLEDSPRTWFDEGIYLSLAKNLAEYEVYGMYASPDVVIPNDAITVGYPFIFPLAALFNLFGSSLLVARLFAISWIFLLCFVVFHYVREKSNNRWTALLAVLLLSVFSPLYGNGKNVLGEVPGLVFLFVSVWAFERLLQKGTMWYAIVAGVGATLASASKPLFLPFLAIFGLYTLYTAMTRSLAWKHFFVMWGVGAVFFVVWIATQFSTHTDFLFVWNHYLNPYNVRDVWAGAWYNVRLFFSDPSPAHFLCMMVVSFCVVVWYRKNLHTFIPLYFFSLFLLVNFLKSPPWYRYFFVAHVIVIVLSSFVWARLLENVRVKKFIMGVLVLLVVGQGYYTVTHIDRMYYPPWREVREIVENNNGRAFFINVPECEFFARERNYAQYLYIRDGLSYGGERLVSLGEYDLIITRDMMRDVELVREMVPSYRERHIGNYFVFERIR